MSVAALAALSPLIIAAGGGLVALIRWIVREVIKFKRGKTEPPTDVPKIVVGEKIAVGPTWAEGQLQIEIGKKEAERLAADQLARRMMMGLVIYEDWRRAHLDQFTGSDAPPDLSRFLPDDVF